MKNDSSNLQKNIRKKKLSISKAFDNIRLSVKFFVTVVIIIVEVTCKLLIHVSKKKSGFGFDKITSF